MTRVGGYNVPDEPPPKYGEPYFYDPQFRGPKRERSLTDVASLIIFGIVVVIWLAIGFWAIGTSDFIRRVSSDTTKSTSNGYHPPRNETDILELVKFFKELMPPVFVGLLLTMCGAIGLIFTMRWIAGPITWSIIAVFHAFLLIVAVTGFVGYSNNRIINGDSANSYLCFGIIATVALIFFLIMLFFVRKRIKFSIAVIKESSRAVSSMWSTVFFPIIPAIFKIAVIEFTVVVVFCLWALKETNARQYSDGLLAFFHAMNFIVGTWLLLFISALSEMSLAGAFGTWYWTYDKADVPYFAMTLAAARSVWYHSGTAAFGSLLITICRVLRALSSSNSSSTDCCVLCLRCCLSCIQDFLQRFNRNAYIMCAVHGKGLCSSAMSAYRLILRNVLRILATDLVAGLVFGFCTFFLAAVTGWLGWLYFDKYFPLAPAFPVVILCVGAYFIASTFFSVFSMAVDTLVLCALEDAERNDGSIQRPYYMSRRLMKLLVKDDSVETHGLLHNDNLHFNHY